MKPAHLTLSQSGFPRDVLELHGERRYNTPVRLSQDMSHAVFGRFWFGGCVAREEIKKPANRSEQNFFKII
eukprot:5980063-Amphidinium_carterae.1